MKEDNVGIYSIFNKKNLKRYIGKSNNIHSRFSHHRRELRKGIHANDHLQKFWNKYGEDYFTFEILENRDEKSLSELEIFYIDKYKSFEISNGYNLTKGGEKQETNIRRNQKKMSESHKKIQEEKRKGGGDGFNCLQ